MSIKFILSCFFVLLGFGLFGQKKDSTKIKNILKTTPSYIFDFDNTFTIGLEHYLKNNKSIQMELGYGNSNQNLLIAYEGNQSSAYKGFNNFRLRSELRFYVINKNSMFPLGTYTSIELFGKYIYKNSYQSVGRNVINWTPSYYEYVLINQKRTVFGSHIKFGYQFKILNNNQKSRMLMDIYGEIGFRAIYNYYDYPGKLDTDQNWNIQGSFGKIFDSQGKIGVISATAGFKLGYILKR